MFIHQAVKNYQINHSVKFHFKLITFYVASKILLQLTKKLSMDDSR